MDNGLFGFYGDGTVYVIQADGAFASFTKSIPNLSKCYLRMSSLSSENISLLFLRTAWMSARHLLTARLDRFPAVSKKKDEKRLLLPVLKVGPKNVLENF